MSGLESPSRPLRRTWFTVRVRLVLSTVLVLALCLTLVVLAVSLRGASLARSDGFRSAQAAAESTSWQLRQSLGEAVGSAHDVATALGALSRTGADRRQADGVLRDVLVGHPAYLGTWVGWEPDAFDGRDRSLRGTDGTDGSGRYIPYWVRDGDQITRVPLVDYEKPGAGDYYVVPRRTGQPKLIDPYVYKIGGKDTLMTSVAVPILRSGRVVGVAGVDLALSRLQQTIGALRPLDVGRVTLVSSQGTVIASGAGLAVGKPLDERTAALTRRAAATGAPQRQELRRGEVEVLQVAVPAPLDRADTWSVVVEVPTSAVLASADATRRLAILLALAGLAVALAAGFALSRSVVRPIVALRDRMAQIADGEGDLTQRVAVTRQDELGSLACSFNRFVDRIAETVRGITGSAAELSLASGELGQISHSLAASTGATSDLAAAASTSAEEVGASVGTVSAGAEQMAGSIQQISSGAAQAAQVAAAAVEQVEAAEHTVTDLRASSTEIGSVLALITAIAEQTNLLALNATIEAARAGDAGKGFAVVAEEVKQLAQETARATEDISRRVTGIQADTDRAASAIGGIGAVIGQISEQSVSIAAAVEEQTATTDEINRAIANAAAGTGEIAGSISRAADTASDTARGAAQVEQAAGQLEEVSTRLAGLVGRFRA